jgi:hypothetical protein
MGYLHMYWKRNEEITKLFKETPIYLEHGTQYET